MSIRSKLKVQAVAASVAEFASWEIIPQAALEDALDKAHSALDRELNRDKLVIWSAPETVESDLKERFKLSSQLTEAARQRKEAEDADGDPPMPPSLNQFVLTQFLKNGSRLCTSFNVGTCTNDRCRSQHKCAVVQKTGRACGGTHTARECWGRRAASLSEVKKLQAEVRPTEAEEGPGVGSPEPDEVDAPTSSDESVSPQVVSGSAADKKRPSGGVPEPSQPPKKKAKAAAKVPDPAQPPKKAKVEQPVKTEPKAAPKAAKGKAKSVAKAAASSSGSAPKPEEEPSVVELPTLEIPEPVTLAPSDRRFDELATVDGKRAVKPSRVLKLASGGELWISGIPTSRTSAQFPRVDLQVCCLSGPPESRQGVTLPNAHLSVFTISNPNSRTDEWKKLFPLIRASLYQGDVVLVHCIAGKHRAAVAGVMILAIFCKLSVTDAIKEVLRHRPVRIDQAFEDRAFAQWAHDMVNTTRLSQPWPKCSGWITTERSHCHVQTMPGITLCCHRQGQASYERLRNPLVTTDRFEAAAWGRVFCPGCKARCPASFLLDL
eukprot:Skav211853  [mRNA]  locus=scaffold1622:146541:148184:- [translate_table: standard]